MTRWSFSSTGQEVVDTFPDKVKGKTILVTGPSLGGIGAETAVTLASALPSTIVLTGRSPSKITPIIQTINSNFPSISVHFIPLDLSSLANVRNGAKQIKEVLGEKKIDILICNAAIMACPFEKSEDGVEIQFATNFLGHFLLVNLLRERIEEGARVVCVSSSAHHMGGVRFEDVNFGNGESYNEWESYGQSKTAMILFAGALARRLEKRGGQAFSLHPGSIRSGLQVNMFAKEGLLQDGLARAEAAEKAAGREFKREPLKTLQQGCATTLVAALDPEIEKENGAYLVNGDVYQYPLSEYAAGEGNQEKLWRLGEKLVGEKFEW